MKPFTTANIEARFMQYVQPSLDGCWHWSGALAGNGYGAFWIRPRMAQSHRLSYWQWRGEVPEGLYVCHKCDVRLCVNPDHLFLGTAKDNAEDMVRKGRGKSRGRQRHPESPYCVNGHLLDKANMRIDVRGAKVCRTCDRVRRQAARNLLRAMPGKGV